MTENEILEAAIHRIRSKWVGDVLSFGVEQADGSVLLPGSAVKGWRELAAAQFSDLPDQERKALEDDALEVVKSIALVISALMRGELGGIILNE